MNQIETVKQQIQDLIETNPKEKRKEIEKLVEVLQGLLYENLNNQICKKENNDLQYEVIINEDEKINYKDILYLHDQIVSNYGIFKYDTQKYKMEQENLKQEWLKSQKDSGKLYYELYNKIINESEYNDLIKKKEEVEEDIEKIINIVLTLQQKNIYNDALTLIYEYNSYKIKTHKVKEKYKKILYIFSELYNESHINIHDYISKKFNISIVINYSQKDLMKQNTKINENFNIYLDKYVEILSKLQISKKYIKNSKKCLLSNYKKHLSTYTVDEYVQIGKYFKKWVDLTQDEKYERLESFSKYYIHNRIIKRDKKMNNKEMYTLNDQPILYNYLKKTLDEKKLNYHNIKWNIKKGVIEKINFESTPHSENSTLNEFELKEKQIRKSIPQTTILSKINDRDINKYILTFLMEQIKEKVDKNVILSSKYKTLCFNIIKAKMDIKRISKDDLIIMTKKYKDIFDIICAEQ